MNNFIELISTYTALLGVALLVGSGLARIMGMYHIGSFEAEAVFSGGMGMLLISIVGRLHLMKKAS